MPILGMPHKVYVKLLFETRRDVSNSAQRMPAGMYVQAKTKLKSTLWIRILSTISRAVLVLTAWVALNISVPSMRRLTLLDSPLWKWGVLALALTFAYLEASLIPVLLFMVFKSRMVRNSLSIDYFHYNMHAKISVLLYFGLVLVSWRLYFGTHRGLNHASVPRPEAFEFVTWTCVSLFVGSFLWLLKIFFMLKYWYVEGIYRRFEARILTTGIRYDYLALLVGEYNPGGQCILVLYEQSKPTLGSVTGFIMSAKANTSLLKTTTLILVNLADIVRSRDGDGTPEVVKWCQDRIAKDDEECGLDDLRELFAYEETKRTAKFLYDIIREECSTDKITFNDLKKWLVDAHKECVNLGRTLRNAREVVKSLGAFLLCVLVVAVVILWLLITGIATTKVLLTIATPLLAMTFVFGDTAKMFFQGVVFTAVIHPFQVGDRCIIDETELEVENISTFTTTFTKIASQEKRMYPNSVLATKAIVNLGAQPDPSDVVELTLDSSITVTELQNLEAKINEFFSDAQQKGMYEKSHEVMLKEIGETVKVTIHFRHVLSIKEVTHIQCLQKKNRQRSQFLKQLKYLLDLSK